MPARTQRRAASKKQVKSEEEKTSAPSLTRRRRGGGSATTATAQNEKSETKAPVEAKPTPIYKRRSKERHRTAVKAPVEENNPFVKRTVTKRKGAAKKKYTVEEIEKKWEDWKDIYLVGTEWSAYDSVFDVDWDFDHLEEKLMPEEDGKDELDLKGKNVFVFGSTEPQMIDGIMRHIPVLIVVVGGVPPPSKIGIKSVQMIEEEIIDMDELKMSWAPYIPKEDRAKTITKRNIPNIFFLHCSTRRSALKHMKELEVIRYSYALPYFIRPSKYLAELDNDGTEVSFVWAPNKSGAMNLTFDWEMDDREDWIEDTLKQNELPADKYKDSLMKELRENVVAAKEALKKKKAERQAVLDKIPAYERQAMEELKFFKFYPQKPDVSELHSTFINRYYGHATKVFPEKTSA